MRAEVYPLFEEPREFNGLCHGSSLNSVECSVSSNNYPQTLGGANAMLPFHPSSFMPTSVEK